MPANNTANGRLQNEKNSGILDSILVSIRGGVTRVDIPNCLNRFWIREGFRGKIGQLDKKNNNNSLPIDAKTRSKVRVRFKMHEANFFHVPISPPPIFSFGDQKFIIKKLFVKPNLFTCSEKYLLESLRPKKIYSYLFLDKALLFQKYFFYSYFKHFFSVAFVYTGIYRRPFYFKNPNFGVF